MPAAKETVVVDATLVETPVGLPSHGVAVTQDVGSIRDAAGRYLGPMKVTCTMPANTLSNHPIEHCQGTFTTPDGTARLTGAPHQNGGFPARPWKVDGLSGRLAGLHGWMGFQMNSESGRVIQGGVPTVRIQRVAEIRYPAARHLTAGIVAVPAANRAFVTRANATCDAIAHASAVPHAPPVIDPIHPSAAALLNVGRFFRDQQRRSPDAVAKLVSLGTPPTERAAWTRVLNARRAVALDERAQTQAALAEDAATFIRWVKAMPPRIKELVLATDVFGVEPCSFV
jgi:hypothetical protein